MKVGFTGSRQGMTEHQVISFRTLISNLDFDEFHHGDCVGSDVEAHNMILLMKPDVMIIIHPPSNNDKRAFCKGHKILDKKEYLARNKDIVNETDILIAIPKTPFMHIRSGTWSTVRYAKSKNKKVIAILPNGNCRRIIGDKNEN